MTTPSKILVRISIALLAVTGGALAQDQDVPAKKAEPVFENGMAQKVEAFSKPAEWIRHDLWVETEFDSDGNGKRDRVHVDVTRPKQTDTEGLKVPVVYNTSPYFSGVARGRNFFWNPNHELGEKPPERGKAQSIRYSPRRPLISQAQVNTWVPRGFAVVHSASPGTGMSQGCPTVGGKNESLAPKAVIDWLNGRAKGFTEIDGNVEVKATWCTGKVGMIGTSYNGTLPLAAATTGVEGLEAIIPVAPNTSYYHYYRSHGLVRHPGGYMGEDIDVLYDFINSGNPKGRNYCDSNVRDKAMAKGMDRLTGDYNDFWAGRDYLNQLKPLKAAVLMAHAFNDWNVMPEHSVRIYQALKARGDVTLRCYFHQGAHGGEPPHEHCNKWFTRFLYGVENGVEKEPKAWIVREGKSRRNPTAYPDYPHPEATPVELHPQGSGNKVGALSLSAGAKSGIEKVVDDVQIRGAVLARAEESPNRLLYATPELKEPVHISGYGRLKIRLACSKRAANLSVWVVSLPFTRTRQITDNIITRGWADPQNHESIHKSKKLKPGKYYELDFELQPDDQVIPAGQKIGVMIFSSDRDFTLWPKPGTVLSVDLTKTSLTLPIVGGAKALEKATK